MTQPQELAERLRSGDAPIIEQPHPITTNEAHGLILGFSLGTLLGKEGRALIGVLAIAYTIARPKTEHRHIGSKTLTHEPWWFAGGLLIGYFFGKRFNND